MMKSHRFGSLCVFCGSSTGNHPAYARAARELAAVLLRNNTKLVYGGANVGLMHILAETMLLGGGQVTGIMPRHLVDREVAHTGLTGMHIVESMQERKALMEELSEGFIALPGGYGTMDELFEVLSWNQLGMISKPVGLLNIHGFFEPLLRLLDHAVEVQFLRSEHRSLLIADNNPDTLLTRMHTFQPVKAEKWIERLKEGRL